MFERFVDAPDRLTLWEGILRERRPTTAAEVGVLEGAFAARMLAAAHSIERYYMVDPWRHLDDWNKPANRPDDAFERVFAAAMDATAFAAERRVVLRGTTLEVVDRIEEGSLDFAYVDGDHTLRGITIDLLQRWPKMRPGGVLAGDDFSPTIWQHETRYEPTLVFPWAVHFAEAHGAPIWCLPHNQFAIEVPTVSGGSWACHDLTGAYSDSGLRSQLRTPDAEAPPSRLRRRSRRL